MELLRIQREALSELPNCFVRGTAWSAVHDQNLGLLLSLCPVTTTPHCCSSNNLSFMLSTIVGWISETYKNKEGTNYYIIARKKDKGWHIRNYVAWFVQMSERICRLNQACWWALQETEHTYILSTDKQVSLQTSSLRAFLWHRYPYFHFCHSHSELRTIHSVQSLYLYRMLYIPI